MKNKLVVMNFTKYINKCIFQIGLTLLVISCNKINNEANVTTIIDGYVIDKKTNLPIDSAWVTMGYNVHGGGLFMIKPSIPSINSLKSTKTNQNSDNLASSYTDSSGHFRIQANDASGDVTVMFGYAYEGISENNYSYKVEIGLLNKVEYKIDVYSLFNPVIINQGDIEKPVRFWVFNNNMYDTTKNIANMKNVQFVILKGKILKPIPYKILGDSYAYFLVKYYNQ
jgi:hypothetical protein